MLTPAQSRLTIMVLCYKRDGQVGAGEDIMSVIVETSSDICCFAVFALVDETSSPLKAL